MDLDSFLASPRWELLKIISEKRSSPIEIAKETNTTVSYVSQQLKLLEAIGIVRKDKTGAALKGQPRNLYSLNGEFVYLIVLANGFSEKKKVLLTERHKMFLRVWMYDDVFVGAILEKILFYLENKMKDIDAIFLDNSFGEDVKMVFVSEKKGLKQDIVSVVKEVGKNIGFVVKGVKEVEKMDVSASYVLYDPGFILKTKREGLKGGE